MAENKHPSADLSEVPPGGLRKGAPTKNQESKIRDAKVPDEKPHETTVAQVEEITNPDRG